MSTPSWVTILYSSVPQVTFGAIRLWLLRALHMPTVRWMWVTTNSVSISNSHCV